MKISLTGANFIYQKLLKKGIDSVFGYSGGSIMALIDKFHQSPINLYINTHEQSTGHSATGYAKSSGKCGVAIVTSGPGVTNMVTPLLDANNDSTPLVLFSGQVSTEVMGTRAFQECDATNITKSVTKWNYCVKDASELVDVVDEAFRIAETGKPGSVHIDLPKDILYQNVVSYNKEIKKKVNKLSYSHIYQIVTKINNSKKPILYLGKGANHASLKIKELVEKFKIPVTNTIHAQGVYDTTQSLALNFLGMHGSAAANYAIQESDCIIAIGSRFDDRTTGNLELYAPVAKENKAIIHCNIDSSEHNLSVQSHFNITLDSNDFLDKLLNNLMVVDRGEWISRITNLKKNYPFVYELGEQLKTQEVIQEINRQLGTNNLYEKTYITTGVGNHQMMTSQFIDWKYPNRMITSGSLGVMGAGLPYAIGAQIANPDSLVIDIDGDGSFNHTLSELKTLVEYNLPIKIAIMNDFHHSMVKVWEELFFDSRFTATSSPKNPEYSDLAKSYGIRGIKCGKREELQDSVDILLNYPGPILVDFRVESDKCYPLVCPGKGLDEMMLPKCQSGSKFRKNFDILPPS